MGLYQSRLSGLQSFSIHILVFCIYSGEGCVSKLLKFYFAFENTQVLKFLQLIGNNVIQ